jgi:4-hydroxy-3-methylbut-2-enyl diphosphate reductase
MNFKLYLTNPRGFCAGVDRAIKILDYAVENLPHPVYVKHEVVHNKHVITNFKKKGVKFIEDISEIPEKSTLIFSAHGVSQDIRNQATQRKLKVLDATCPLVTKVHNSIKRFDKTENEIIMIGHNGHPEVEGTVGQLKNKKIRIIENENQVDKLDLDPNSELAFVTQTTLSVDDTSSIVKKLRTTFPKIKGPSKNDICYATQNRQDAIKKIASFVDLFIIVGSQNSSNSNRLVEVANQKGIIAYLVEDESKLVPNWFTSVSSVGLSAGASAPDFLLQRCITKLKEFGANEVIEYNGVDENVKFNLPKEIIIHEKGQSNKT